MSDQLTDAHHEWVRNFTGGAVDPARQIAQRPGSPAASEPGSPPGGAAAPVEAGAVFHVQIYNDHAGTRKTMELCETIVRSGAKAVTIAGKEHKVQEVLSHINKQIHQSAHLIRSINADSLEEAIKLEHDERGMAWVAAKLGGVSAKATMKTVTDLAHESETFLSEAESAVGAGYYVDAYENLLAGINAGFKSRSAVSAYDQKLVTGAERAVTGLTVVRDGSFTALGVLSGVAEVGLVVGTGIALMPAAAELYTKAMTGEKINWASAGADALLTVLEQKFGGELTKKLKGVCGPAVQKLVLKLPAKVHLTPEQEEKVVEFLVDKLKENGHKILQGAAGSFCKQEGDKKLSYTEAAKDFIDKSLTVDAAEKFIGTLLLSQALQKVGIKVDAHDKAAKAAPPPST